MFWAYHYQWYTMSFKWSSVNYFHQSLWCAIRPFFAYFWHCGDNLTNNHIVTCQHVEIQLRAVTRITSPYLDSNSRTWAPSCLGVEDHLNFFIASRVHRRIVIAHSLHFRSKPQPPRCSKKGPHQFAGQRRISGAPEIKGLTYMMSQISVTQQCILQCMGVQTYITQPCKF